MSRVPGTPLRIASLAKQVPLAESLELDGGTLVRAGVPLEMNPYCRRAVAEGVALARDTGGTCTVVTLGPESAEDVLREAVAWGADEGLHACDPAFAGSDTLATARALAAVLRAAGPFDLVLLGRNSIDGETGQVGPELAELLDLPFASGVRRLQDLGAVWRLELELDDGTQDVELTLPAVLSVAERLCDPCKIDPEGRAAVSSTRLTRLDAARLGPGPWGEAGSPTLVGATRAMEHERAMRVLEGPLEAQVDEAVQALTQRGALTARSGPVAAAPDDARFENRGGARIVAVLAEPGRPAVTEELLGAAAQLGGEEGAAVHALCAGPSDVAWLGAAGADVAVVVRGSAVAEDVADALGAYVREVSPWAVLAPSTAFGREVAARAAAATGSGLVGDAVALSAHDDVLVAAKPAFAGALVADITCRSATQMVTVRPGVLPAPTLRSRRDVPVLTRTGRHPWPRPGAGRAAQRRRGDTGAGPGRDRRRQRGHARGLRGAEPAGRPARSRARRHPQGDRQGLGTSRPPGGHHGPVHRPEALRRHRAQREVQPHGRGPGGGNDPGRECRPRRARLRALRSGCGG